MSAWKNKYIKPSKWARPQLKLNEVKKIVIHWTANYGATAMNHFNYFNNLSGRYASAHLFVDKKEALCIVPLDEICYHANDGTYKGIPELRPNANFLSIGIEMCVEKDGTFHPDTITRTENVAVELCKMYNLDPIKDIVRHYDITHKSCPTPWVRNGQLFINFKNRVEEKFNGNKGDDLTVSQFETLKKMIDKKLDKPSNYDNKQPSWGNEIWHEVSDVEKYFDGTRPHNFLSRIESGVLLKRITDNIDKYKVEPLKREIEELKREIAELKINN